MLLLLGSSCACSSFGSSSCTCNHSCSCKWKADQVCLLSCFCNKEWGCTLCCRKEWGCFYLNRHIECFCLFSWLEVLLPFSLFCWSEKMMGVKVSNGGMRVDVLEKNKNKEMSTGKYIDHPKSRSWWWFDMFMLVSICFI